MGNCKKKCPLKVSWFTDEYTLGYCAGKVQTFYKAEKNQEKKKPERNQEYERE